MIESFLSPHEWQPKAFDHHCVVIELFSQLSHVFGFQLFNWWWIDFHHWFDNNIWFGDNIWSFLVIKCKPYMSILIFSFEVCDVV